MYIYPDNLKQKATMWLWRLSDLAIIGVSAIISILLLTQLRLFAPIVATAVYSFLTIQFEGASVKDFLRHAINYFVIKPQFYTWGVVNETIPSSKTEKKKA